jgi:transcriptional regulator with XRE-family HTH domain
MQRFDAECIRDELSRRGWSASRLGREAGINQTEAIQIVNGSRKAGPTARRRIAGVFGWPEVSDDATN